MRSIFEFRDYKAYLAARLPTSGEGRGLRTKLAGVLGCRGAFVSQVISKEAHFSLEHAARVDEFLGHSPVESHYFLLLVHLGRAGSPSLRRYYSEQLDRVLAQREVVTEKIRVRSYLSNEEQIIYYSTWHFAAIHMLLLIPELRTKQAIAAHLNLPLSRVSETLDFLVQVGLAVEESGSYLPGKSRLHVGERSPHVNRHHTNWRLHAISALERDSDSVLRYSGPIVLSKKKIPRLRALLLEAIGELEGLLVDEDDVDDEEPYVFSVDLYPL